MKLERANPETPLEAIYGTIQFLPREFIVAILWGGAATEACVLNRLQY